MKEQTTNIISATLLSLVSILMIAVGLGFLASKYYFVVGIIYFILAVLFIEGILKKLFDDI